MSGGKFGNDKFDVNPEFSKSDKSELLSAGQIEPGDIIQATYRGDTKRYDVENVLYPGTDKEEIILGIEKNLYFITSMAIDSTSWAKNVMIEGR